MIKLVAHNFVINLLIAKSLLNNILLYGTNENGNFKLCSDCDCGCASNSTRIELCSDCDCGCKGIESDKNDTCVNNCQDSDSNTAFSSGGDDNNDDNDLEDENCHNENLCKECDEDKDNEINVDCDKNIDLANQYLNLAKQIQADFDNYRRRNNDAIKQAKNEGIKETVLAFLPALDAVERAIKYTTDKQSVEGLLMIKKVFEKTFGDYNIQQIHCLGEHYDPNFHNVVFAEESDKESGTIIEEIEKGYIMNDKVIKHSIVKISK